MKKALVSTLFGLSGVGLASAANIFTPGDFIIAIDTSPVSNGSHPGGEPPSAVLDGNSGTKYLNFGKENSGFIVTPAASSVIQSMVLTTAGDDERRDPASYLLYGTNDAIVSTNNSTGSLENWTLIQSGSLTLPSLRNTVGDPVDIVNATAYSSYRLIFDTIKDSATNSMQIADVQFYSGTGGLGDGILAVGNAIIAVDLDPIATLYPAGEAPAKVIDGLVGPDPGNKYLSFGKDGSGFITVPSVGASIVQSFQIVTANDAPGRDPASYSIYGTNDAITSADASMGTDENWILIQSGSLSLPADRNAAGEVVLVDNSTAYTAYKVVFDSLKDSAGVNSMQISEIQFDGIIVPEPSSALLGLTALLIPVLRRRREL